MPPLVPLNPFHFYPCLFFCCHLTPMHMALHLAKLLLLYNMPILILKP